MYFKPPSIDESINQEHQQHLATIKKQHAAQQQAELEKQLQKKLQQHQQEEIMQEQQRREQQKQHQQQQLQRQHSIKKKQAQEQQQQQQAVQIDNTNPSMGGFFDNPMLTESRLINNSCTNLKNGGVPFFDDSANTSYMTLDLNLFKCSSTSANQVNNGASHQLKMLKNIKSMQSRLNGGDEVLF
jgi:hypothetical protein